MNETGAAHETSHPRESKTRAAARQLAHRIQAGHLGPGEIAELRRTADHEIGGAAFWRIATRDLEPEGLLRHGSEDRWLVATSLIARIGPQHDPKESLGAALASADLSEPRLFRLLRSAGPALDDAARVATQYLVSKRVRVDCADLAELVVEDPSSARGISLRRRIARSFYATRHRNSSTDQTPGEES